MTAIKRTRLSPQDRRTQLLDCAQLIILEQGFNSFTMDGLATAASISNPLVYKYFSSRLALLQELLLREFERYYSQIEHQLARVDDFEQLLVIVVGVNFEEVSRGSIMHILRKQPDVNVAMEARAAKKLNQYGSFLVEELKQHFSLPVAEARTAVAIASGASQAAAEHYSRFGGDKTQLIKDTVQFIICGISGLAKNAASSQTDPRDH